VAGTGSPFDERLELLVETGQITPTARELTEHVVAEVEAGLGVRLDEDNGAPFVTHLAVALSRVERGEEELLVSEAVNDEIRDFPREYELMQRLLEQCGSRLGRPIPAPEVAFLTAHACALVEE
jgi:transcriptional regulatory protein LevR